MAFAVYSLPNYEGDKLDLVALDPTRVDAGSPGLAHYAYSVAARENVLGRRSVEWFSTQNFNDAGYQQRNAETIRRLSEEDPYKPGESVLAVEVPDFSSQLNTVIRLGALELLANIHAGRLTAAGKDPFPHQLALQQFMRRASPIVGPQRLLIADEVGLGKI